MDFHIEHRLDYRYDRPVFLEPFQLRLRPRSDPAQRLLHHNLEVSPDPSGRSLVLEANGNEAVSIWFQELTDHLSLKLEARVETLLHGTPEAAAELDYLRHHTGFARIITVTEADLDRVGGR